MWPATGRRSRTAPPAPAARLTAASGAWCARCSSPTPTPKRCACRSAPTWPHDARVFPAPIGQLRLPRIPQARSGRARFRRHAGVLRPAQLDRGLAQDGRGEDREDLRRGRWLRPAPGVRLRLCRQPAGVAAFARAAVEGGDAQGTAPQAEGGEARSGVAADVANAWSQSPFKRSARRTAKAMIVSVGLAHPAVGMTEPPAMYRLPTLCILQLASTTPYLASEAMRVAPITCSPFRSAGLSVRM